MAETMHTLLTRRACRSYTDEPVAKEDIEKIVKAGVFAPTGMGRQSPIIIAVTNKEVRDCLSKAIAAVMGKDDIDPFYGAPVVLVVLADKTIPTYLYDGSCVMENLMLAAADLGLGSCWIHRAKEVFASELGRKILADLKIEGDYEGIGNVILGHPASAPAEPKERKANYVYCID